MLNFEYFLNGIFEPFPELFSRILLTCTVGLKLQYFCLQVKDPNMDAEGADVIQHMIDNFIV